MKLLRVFAVVLVLAGGTGYYWYVNSFDRGRGGAESHSEQTDDRKEHDDTVEDSSSDDVSNTTDDKTSKPYDVKSARVLRAYDGDSLKVRLLDSKEVVEIRIKGIDCPETSEDVDKCGPGGLVDLPCDEQIPLGIRAKSYAKAQLEDQTVKLESYNNFNRGDYGRILAYVRMDDGEDYGLETVKKGYCNDSGRIYSHPRDDQYEAHQKPLKR